MISKGLSFNLGVLEETLTDINLIQIASAHPEYIVTRKFSRRMEGTKTGADWLWCIGSPGSWLCLLVQAKIVNPQTRQCFYLHYRGGEQRRLLQQYARTHRLLPLYCIYGLVQEEDLPKERIHGGLPSETHQWTCTLLPPRVVKALSAKKRRSHAALLERGMPWKSLFCDARQDATSLARVVADGWDRFGRGDARQRMRLAVDRSANAKMPRIMWDDPNPELLLHSEFPRIVERLLDPRTKASPMAGVSVISSIPIAQLSNELRLLEPGDRRPPEWWEISKARWEEKA